MNININEMFFLNRFYGLKSLKVALSHHLCARIQSCRGDFRSALNSEREAYQIYKLQVNKTEKKLPKLICSI